MQLYEHVPTLSTPRGCASNGGYRSLVGGGTGEAQTTTGTRGRATIPRGLEHTAWWH